MKKFFQKLFTLGAKYSIIRGMKYIAETLKYIVKNLWYILLFGVLPAAFFVGAFDYSHFTLLVKSFFTGKLTELTYLDLFRAFSLLNVSSWYGVLCSLFGFFVICIMMSVLLALIEKHMRIGKRTFNGVFSKINDNILATILVALCVFLIYEIWTALMALAEFCIILIFAKAPVAAYIFGIIAFALMVWALMHILSYFMLWLPCQLITGFHVFEALTYSAHLSENKRRRLLPAILLPLLIGNGILSICVLGGTPALAPVVFVVDLIYFLYYGTLMEIAYFMDAEMEREDLKPDYKRR